MKKKTGPKGPHKKTPELVSKLEQAFSIGLTKKEACLYADISRPAFYDWMEKDPEFSYKMEHAMAQPAMQAKHTIFKNLDKPSIAIRFLERQSRQERARRDSLTEEERYEYQRAVEKEERRRWAEIKIISRESLIKSWGRKRRPDKKAEVAAEYKELFGEEMPGTPSTQIAVVPSLPSIPSTLQVEVYEEICVQETVVFYVMPWYIRELIYGEGRVR